MSKFKINPTSILETIRKQIDCPNLYNSVEDEVVLTLDLEDYFIYFIIEQINNGYRLTIHNFNNTMYPHSVIRTNHLSIDDLITRIVKYTITKTKLKGIRCNIKLQFTP